MVVLLSLMMSAQKREAEKAVGYTRLSWWDHSMSLGGQTTVKVCTVLVMAKIVVLFTEHEQLITQLTAQRRAEINIST